MLINGTNLKAITLKSACLYLHYLNFKGSPSNKIVVPGLLQGVVRVFTVAVWGDIRIYKWWGTYTRSVRNAIFTRPLINKDIVFHEILPLLQRIKKKYNLFDCI